MPRKGPPPAADMRPGSVHSTLLCGDMTVVAYTNSKNISVRFKDTGTELSGIDAGNIRRGEVADPVRRTCHGLGYMGQGKFSAKYHKAAHSRWASMIKRVHFPVKRMILDYAGCGIVEDWYNFQLFAEWYYHQPYAGLAGYELDKDLLFEGNRVYGPNTCSLIPKVLNSALSLNRKNSLHGAGAYFVKATSKFTSSIQQDGVKLHLGTFDTKEEANEAFERSHHGRLISLATNLFNEGAITETHLNALLRRCGTLGNQKG